MEEETKRDDIDMIIDDLGANYKDDENVLKNILEEVSSIAFDISHNKNKEQLFPYVKRAVKAEYIQRGSEGLLSRTEGSVSSQFEDITEKMRRNIIKNGLRRLP